MALACASAAALLFAVAAAAPAAAAPLTAAHIDRLIAAEWRRRAVAPASPVDDAGFLRRAYLDLLGTLPSEEVAGAFLQDRARDKRDHLIAKLLQDPRHAEHFTDYWEGILFPRGRRAQQGDVDRGAFRAWLRERLAEGAPWDRVVADLVGATGTNSLGGPRDPVTGAGVGAKDLPPAPSPLSGAVNFLLLYDRNPQDLASVISREFLGVQIQCAQCHKHPTERFTQEDFRRFAAALAYLRQRPVDKGPIQGVRRVEIIDAPRPLPGGPQEPELRAIAAARPTALDGTDLGGPNPRQALAAWLTGAKNPWFSRALVNRYWAYLVGRGFCEPVDDLRPSNPVTMPRLLDLLARDFAASGFDLRRLIRLITQTRVYQLSPGPARDRDAEHKLWTRHPLRPLGPSELLDSIVVATGLPEALGRAGASGDQLDRVRQRLKQSLSFVFDIDEELDRPEYLGTVQQALYLLNGSLIGNATRAAPGGALATLLAAPIDDRARIEALYLRALTRPPTTEEVEAWLAFLAAPRELVPEAPPPPRIISAGRAALDGRRPQAPDPLRGLQDKLRPKDPTPRQQAFEDLFWVLLNSSEFVFRR